MDGEPVTLADDLLAVLEAHHVGPAVGAGVHCSCGTWSGSIAERDADADIAALEVRADYDAHLAQVLAAWVEERDRSASRLRELAETLLTVKPVTIRGTDYYRARNIHVLFRYALGLDTIRGANDA